VSRDGRTNKAHVYTSPRGDAKEAVMDYAHLASSRNFHLLEVTLHTGRHHQIRAQLAKVGSPIRGDLKYGAARSNTGGGISLHSRSVSFEHPVTHAPLRVVAPPPADDTLWRFFAEATEGQGPAGRVLAQSNCLPEGKIPPLFSRAVKRLGGEITRGIAYRGKPRRKDLGEGQ
jgi:hypothetical protein